MTFEMIIKMNKLQREFCLSRLTCKELKGIITAWKCKQIRRLVGFNTRLRKAELIEVIFRMISYEKGKIITSNKKKEKPAKSTESTKKKSTESTKKKSTESTTEKFPLKNKKVCITGKLSKNRKEIEELLRKKGAIVLNHITKSLDYLIKGDKVGATKIEKAKKYNIMMITEKDLNL